MFPFYKGLMFPNLSLTNLHIVFRFRPCPVLHGAYARFAPEGGVEYAPGREAASADYFPHVGLFPTFPDQPFGVLHPIPVDQPLQIHSEPTVHRIREVRGIRPEYYFV